MKNIKKALKIIQKGHVHPFDIGKVNQQYFVYVLALGSFAHVSYDTDQKIKKKYGKLAYYYKVMKEVLKTNLFHVKIETADHQILEMVTPLVLVLNSVSVGGFIVNRKSDINDGKFDVLVMKPGFASGLFNVLLKNKHQKIVTNQLSISTDSSFDWCIDGEKGMTGQIFVENLQNHLCIFSKKEYKNK